MSGTVKYSISLEKQPTWVKYKELPSPKYLESVDYEVDSTEYEEYSFTGNLSEIEAQRSRELGAAGKTLQVQATMTRLNGNLWELKIRKNACRKKETEVDEEQQEALEMHYGSITNPKQTSINITAIQESILNHPKFTDIPKHNLGAIKMYMNGALPGEKIQTEDGTYILNDLMHLDDDLVQFAIKNPTYYVPSMTVTYQYWSSSKDTDMSGIAKPKNPPGVEVPEGYTSLYMGSSSSPVSGGNGYTIQESYTIGKFNKAPYEDAKK